MKFAAFAVLLLLQSGLVSAQGYKCELPNGRVAFQDRPCQAGAVHTELALSAQPLTQTASPPAAPVPQLPAGSAAMAAEQQRLDAALGARSARIEAENRATRCEQVRADLDALKLERPVYRTDDKGERQYISDEARPAEIAGFERYVAQNCK